MHAYSKKFFLLFSGYFQRNFPHLPVQHLTPVRHDHHVHHDGFRQEKVVRYFDHVDIHGMMMNILITRSCVRKLLQSTNNDNFQRHETFFVQGIKRRNYIIDERVDICRIYIYLSPPVLEVTLSYGLSFFPKSGRKLLPEHLFFSKLRILRDLISILV